MDAAIRIAALAYIARGWSAIPIEPRGKRPLIAWTEYQGRIACAEEIESWFQRWPHANVGIVTGRVSGLVVLDVDERHGGATSLARLEIDPVPITVEAVTGGGGRHLYFSHPGIPLGNRVGLRPGLDLRGDGGCVVAPPSIHASGTPYLWVTARSPDEAPLAPLPGWFLHTEGGEHIGHPLAHWRRLAREGVAEGARNATIASLAGHLLWHGVDVQVVLGLLFAWNRVRCRPPLEDVEVTRVVDSIARLHSRERSA